MSSYVAPTVTCQVVQEAARLWNPLQGLGITGDDLDGCYARERVAVHTAIGDGGAGQSGDRGHHGVLYGGLITTSCSCKVFRTN